MIRALLYEPSAQATAIAQALEGRRIAVTVARTRSEAEAALERRSFSLVLWSVDTRAPENELAPLKGRFPLASFVALSEDDGTETVVGAIRGGASHFWRRSEDVSSLLPILEDVVSRRPGEWEFEDSGLDVAVLPLHGRHPRMVEIFRLILGVRASDATVLITGESGTGKELVARAIHGTSPRNTEPLVAINCAAIPANLLESELFGYVRGAFTGATQNRPGRFQAAGNGTLFLDEVGDMSLELQAKLLRALQQRTYEPVGSSQSLQLAARIIAATNQDLEQAVAEKRFRQDLFYRLNVIPIHVPALHERRSDIPLLARAFAEQFCRTNGKAFLGFTEEAMTLFVRYHWPGNVRELENLLERVIVLKRTHGPIDVADLPVDQLRRPEPRAFNSASILPEEGIDMREAVDSLENELILQALRRTHGNKNRAASLLKLNRTTLVEKMKRKGLRS